MRLASAFPERAPTPAKVRDLDPTNDLTFLRVRTKKGEIMIAPDKVRPAAAPTNPACSCSRTSHAWPAPQDFTLMVLQDPGTEGAV